MGYCYDLRGRLACDACGHCGGVRKRTCPHRVTYAEGGSLPYCQPAALCKACYATRKATLHADCAAGAARSTAAEVARLARLTAGEFQVRTAWGDWHARVPQGFVGLRAVNLTGDEVYKLVPADDYHAGWLADYPGALDWADPDPRPSKALTVSQKGNL